MAAASAADGGDELMSRLLAESLAHTRELFPGPTPLPLLSAHPLDAASQAAKLATKTRDDFAAVRHLPPPPRPDKPAEPAASAPQAARGAASQPAASARRAQKRPAQGDVVIESVSEDEAAREAEVTHVVDSIANEPASAPASAAAAGAAGGGALVLFDESKGAAFNQRRALILRERAKKKARARWHAPWKLMRVLTGHTGWVKCLAVEPGNEWFASGAADNTIRVWDLASGQLKITLTGHIATVMGLVVSPRHPYLFSCSQDKEIKCWDLEQNRVIRNYHGHFSGVYSIALHPQLDILATGGRDCSVRLWDMRTRAQIHLFEGHRHSVASVQMQASEPQIISGSYDSTVRLWDIVAGRSRAVLTNHKKSVRSVLIHPREYAFASASADNVKIWKCPDGEFLRNCAGHNAVVNALAVNEDDVLVSCADNGTMFFWDWATGEPFQSLRSQPQPGSLDSEAGIFAATFDRSGIRLLTAETDKTIKVWREDETATPESHPVRAPDPAAKQSHF